MTMSRETEEAVTAPGTAPAAPVQSAGPVVVAAPRRSPSLRALLFVPRYALLALLIASLVFYTTWGPTSSAFTNPAILRNIVSSQAVLAVVTLGLLIPLVAGQVDLSIGNIAGLSSILTASAYADYHMPVWAGIIVGIVSGALVGVLNGLVITFLRVNSFVATLGTASVIAAIVSWYTAGLSIIQGIPPSVPAFGAGTWLGVPRIFYVLVVVSLIVYYLLEHTPYGRKLHAIGANAEAARLVGIRTSHSVFVSFILAGALAGLAGVMLLADSGAGNPQVGNGFTFTSVAAVFLGAAAFQIGRVNVPGTLVAIYFLAINITGLTLAGVRDYIQPLFNGVALVLAISLVAILARRRLRSAGGGAAGGGIPGT